MGDGVRRMWRRLTMGALLAGLAIGSLAAPSSAVAPRAPAREPILEWVSLFRAGPVKGAVVVRSGSPGRVLVSLLGVPTDGQLRLVASGKPCAASHTSADRILGVALGDVNRDGTVEYQGRHAVGSEKAIASMRLLSGRGAGDQRACADATAWQHQGPAGPAEYTLENVQVTSYFKAPGPGGLILTGATTDGGITVHAALLGLRGGTRYRLVGSTAACGSKHRAAAKVYAQPFTSLGDTATHEVGHWVDRVVVAQGSTAGLRSVRLFRVGATTTQVECRGIIAVLIGV